MDLCVFALNASRTYGKNIASALGIELGKHEEREFEDGEHKARPLENVRGRDVFVIQSLYGDHQASVNDKLIRLLFFLGAIKDASASRVTAVVPYLCYARKDRKSKSRDPVSTRYTAALFEAAGADRVVTLDVHNLAAYQNAFRIPADHLEALPLFVRYLTEHTEDSDLVVVSPDVGGVKRAEAVREALESQLQRPIGHAFVEKYRSGGVVSGGTLVGDVSHRQAIIIDDLISSGTTIARAVHACREGGALNIVSAVTHGAFAINSDNILAVPALKRILVTDSIPPFRLASRDVLDKLVCLDTAPLFAEAIKRIHTGGSLVELLEP